MGSIVRARARALICSTVWVGLQGPAAQADSSGQTPAAPPVGAPPRVDLAIVGDAAGASGLEDRIGSWFRGQSTVLRTTAMPDLEASSVFAASGAPGVRVWVLLTAPTSAHIVFAVQAGEGRPPRYLVNDVAMDRGLDELAIEQLAQVVYLSAMALWAGNVESSRQDVEASLRTAPSVVRALPRADVAPSPDRGQTLLGAGIEYTVRLEGDEGVAQTLAATLSVLRHRSATELGGRFRAEFLAPRQPSKSGIHLELQGVGFEAGAAMSRRVSERTWIGGEVGPGLEVVSYRVSSVDDPSLRPSDGGINPRPISYARLGARVDLGSFRVACDALVVVQLLRTHYDVVIDSHRSEVLVPWMVQPGLSAGVSW